MYQAVKKAQTEALASLRAGVRVASIHQGVIDRFTAMGFETRLTDGVPEGFIHGTGHGVGLEIHEAPSLGLGEGVLRAGQVVTVEPGLYYTDVGGIRIEDTVVVTREGFDYLATCPKDLGL
jgi:Xaa-Pro aminopeptidase